MVVEVGRVCVKTAGREAGRVCVILEVVDESHVLVSGPEVRRRRCNIKHLEPLEQKLKVRKGTSDESLRLELESAGLIKIEEGIGKPQKKPRAKRKSK